LLEDKERYISFSVLVINLDMRGTNLTFGGADVVELAERFGTPLYVMDDQKIRQNFRAYRSAFPDAGIYYAAKANSNLAVLRILANEGSGADVFSAGELYLALLAGIPSEKILFNGNSKTDDDLRIAISQGIKISVDSMDELNTISKICAEQKCTAEIAFRVNPDIQAKTHPKIATGLRASKFGIPHKEVPGAYKYAVGVDPNHISPVGIHCHTGSQILDAGVFREAATKMLDLAKKISSFVELKFIDIGGGLGIPYRKTDRAPTPRDLADAILPVFEKRSSGAELILEPGRSIVGNAAVLLSRVNTVKKAYKNFVGIDAGFNLLIRPAMYDAYHEVVVANKIRTKAKKRYTVVGPICESGDIIARDRMLPEVEKGDLIAIFDVGAYGFSMSSQYNARPRCAEVLVFEGMADVVRDGETIEDLVRNQSLPCRLL
jgi:diaminopimelate decarboxylase